MPSENKIEFMQGSPRPLWAAFALLLICCGLFLTLNVKGDWDFVLQLRLTKLAALLLVAYAVGVSTQLFQTLTNNPILTPSILGFDALYMFLQTLLVFTLGGVGYTSLPAVGKFGFELTVMMGGSLLLFYTLVKQGGRDLSRMILIGVIFGILFRSLSSLLSRMIDPEEFTAAQANMFASFNTVHNELVKNGDMFVNLGLGIYGLKEWGYQWGSVKEIIARVFKKFDKPMKIQDIIKEVLKEKMINPNTVVLNLQKHKKLFKRVDKGLYQYIWE